MPGVKLPAFIDRLEKDKQPIEKVGQGYKEATTKHTSLVCFAPCALFFQKSPFLRLPGAAMLGVP